MSTSHICFSSFGMLFNYLLSLEPFSLFSIRLSLNDYMYHGISRIRQTTIHVFVVNDHSSLNLIETKLTLTINSAILVRTKDR